jgi:uncharacterized protein
MRKDCGAARDLLSISSNGEIEACDCIDPLGPIAGLGKMQDGLSNELIAARESPIAKKIRSRDISKLKCGECIWLSMCGGTCLAHAGEVDQVWEPQCMLALNAFQAIAESVARSNRLKEYQLSCMKTKSLESQVI